MAQIPAKRVLFVTHSAGFRHDSIAAARETLQTLAPERFEVTATEDLSFISAARLSEFQAVFFFTSGELALDVQQKADLLAFVRNGGGFAGAHSATDTLYTWPEYGELIGGYFDGHPWVGQTDIEIEDPDHPAAAAVAGGGSSFRILDEIYKFRNFSRSRVRVLMTLRSSIGGETGVNKAEYPLDSPLAWCRNYGKGRVFYTALGHFDETWRDERIRRMLARVLGWLTGEEAGDATPRSGQAPRITRVAEAAQSGFPATLAAGAKVSITGENLTSGSTMQASPGEPAFRLAGTWVTLGSYPVRLLMASPTRIDILLPADLPAEGEGTLTVASSVDTNRGTLAVRFGAAIPGIYGVEVQTGQITVKAGGIADARVVRLLLDGEELPRIAAFSTEPGTFAIVVKRPGSLATGVHTLTIESAGTTADFPFYVDVL